MVRGFAEIYFGLAGQMNGQTETVLSVLSDLLNHSSMESPRKLRLLVALVWVHLLSGNLVAASTRNRQLMDAAIESNLAPFTSWGSYNQGVIHFYRNELDSAIDCFHHAAETEYLILTRANIDCLAGLTLAYQAMQQADEADQTLSRLFDFTDSLHDPAMLEIAYSCKRRLSLMRGEAVHGLRLPLPPHESDGQPMVFWLEVPAITNCRLLIADGTDTSLIESEKRLISFLRLNRTHHNTFRTIELMALQSQAVSRQGRLDEALTILGQAIKLAEPGGCIQPFVELGPPMADLLKRLHKQNVFVDYIEQILKSFNNDVRGVAAEPNEHSIAPADHPSRASTPSQPLVEPLTNRELDVLELLAQRLRNKEIAEKLFVSNQTVKTHLKNIYQKLNVSDRRKAVAQAYRLGIITRR
jgi:LuxR family maltose regulon positive regulatory protein